MSEPYLGEIRPVSFNFTPRGWAQCNGQLLPINQNQALFSILGTMYGGDGRVNFALPDLRGRVPIHMDMAGGSYIQGQRGGEVAHTLAAAEIPQHTHLMQASSQAATAVVPGGAVLAVPAQGTNMYAPGSGTKALASATVTTVGGSQAHSNMQPSLVINYIIALQGIFPSQN